MPNATDYWLQGMQVAEQERQSRKKESQTDRDYLTRNKLYYGEDWRGNDKGETDFKASEEARKARIAEDAAAALEPYLGGSRTPALTDPRAVPGMSEADADFGAPQAVVESLPNIQPDAPRYIQVQDDFGAPKSAFINPEFQKDYPRIIPISSENGKIVAVKVDQKPQLLNTDSVVDRNWSFDEMGSPSLVTGKTPKLPKSQAVFVSDQPRYSEDDPRWDSAVFVKQPGIAPDSNFLAPKDSFVKTDWSLDEMVRKPFQQPVLAPSFPDFSPLQTAPVSATPEVQPDAPRYIPVENTLGSPPVAPAAAVPVVAPPVGNDFGASTIPTTPVRPASPVPNTSTFGAPLANIMPTAREVFDNTDPRIRSKPAFLNELKAYEKNRLNQVARLAQAEELGNIRAASAYNLLHERTKSAAELAAEKDKRAMERQDDKQEFEREKYAVLERGRNERYNTGIQTRKDLAELKVKAQAVGAPKIAGADDTIVKESGRQLATKTMAADVMENALGIIEDPNTDPAVAYSEAQSLYKAINSADFRSDAVNGEEAKRIGQLLDINLNPVKIIQTGRVLPSLELYKKQVRDNVNRIRKESDALNNRISSVYAKYGWDYQNAKPLGSAPAQPASTNAPSGPKVMTINGKKVTFTP